MIARSLALLLALAVTLPTTASLATARSRGSNTPYGDRVPNLDVKTSCSDAEKFSSGSGDKDTAFKGCMQDETNAKNELAKRWAHFKGKDKQDCVEQSRNPSPSYVEVLTCLEMDSDSMRNAPVVNGKPVPQIGGPVAPGLNDGTVPNATGVPRT